MSPADRERKNAYERERRRAVRARGISDEQRAKNREHNRVYRERNREKIRARRDPESEAFRNFVYRQRKATGFEKDRYEAWAAANPDKVKAKEQRKRQSSSYKARRKVIDRKKHIARVKDREALGRRVIANAEAAAWKGIDATLRAEIIARLIEGVYAGRFPIKLTDEHQAEACREYFRIFDKFDKTLSLDEEIGEDGFTRGHDIGVY